MNSGKFLDKSSDSIKQNDVGTILETRVILDSWINIDQLEQYWTVGAILDTRGDTGY